jgi:WD40 repeat protein
VESKHAGAVRWVAEVPGDEAPTALRHLSGGDDGKVLAQRWNGEVEVLDEVSGARFTQVAVSPDATRAAWAFEDGTVVLWALKAGKQVLRNKSAVVRSLRFSGDSRRVALGRDDKRVVILDAEAGKEVMTLEETDAAVLAVQWAAKDSQVVVALANGHVQLWDVAARRVAHTWTQPGDRTTSIDVSNDGRLIAAGSDDGHVYVFEVEGGGLFADVPADAGDVLSVAFIGNDALFAAGTDRQVHVFNLGATR